MINFKAQSMYHLVKTKENNDKPQLIQQAYRAWFKLQSVPNMKRELWGEEAYKRDRGRMGKRARKRKKM